MHVSESTLIRAPRERVFAIYANYVNWPRLFPITIKAVHLAHDEGDAKLLEIDHVEGRVTNILRLRPPDTIEVDEDKRRYTGTFLNTFEAVPDGTRYTVAADIHLKGWYKLAAPFVGGYVRRQLMRLVLEPMRQSAEEVR
jgi:Polyketide cyclase / dehydrase and lipid transport